MTRDQIEQWKRERDIARKSGDPALMQLAYDHRDDMQMECICHQSERVKGIKADVESVKDALAEVQRDIPPLKAMHREYTEKKLKVEGMVILWRILRYGFAAGLGGTIVRLLTMQ